MEAEDLVTVYTVNNAVAAEAVRNLLQAEGIACVIGGESQGGFTGVLEILIQTRAIDADRARRIIEQQHHFRE
jgi:hypothetical protein